MVLRINRVRNLLTVSNIYVRARIIATAAAGKSFLNTVCRVRFNRKTCATYRSRLDNVFSIPLT